MTFNHITRVQFSYALPLFIIYERDKNTDSEKMMFVVRDLNILIKDYGLKEVQHALKFIVDYPVQPVAKNHRFRNTGIGSDFFLTDEEVKRIEDTNPRVNKIQAIKMFREITSCGLNEAKEAIERYYDIGYKPW